MPSGPVDIFKLVADSLPTSATTASGAADAELLFVGSKSAGKSSLIHAFLQKDEPPKPSTPLEYRFARKAAPTGAVVANIWELGGASEMNHLLKVVLPAERLACSAVAITLDMSEPEEALQTLLHWIDEVRRHVERASSELSMSPGGAETVAAARKATAALWQEHPDCDVASVEQVSPVGIPLVVIANKWDVFEETHVEGEYRKLVCRALRFFAHQAGGSLLCTKHKDKASLTALRNLLYHHVFGSTALRTIQQDHTKPLVIPASADAFGAIGKPPRVDTFADSTADKWRVAWEQTFRPRDKPKEAQDLSMVEAEQFAEETIDELRRQKRDELLRQRKAAEFEAKMADAGARMVVQ